MYWTIFNAMYNWHCYVCSRMKGTLHKVHNAHTNVPRHPYSQNVNMSDTQFVIELVRVYSVRPSPIQRPYTDIVVLLVPSKITHAVEREQSRRSLVKFKHRVLIVLES